MTISENNNKQQVPLPSNNIDQMLTGGEMGVLIREMDWSKTDLGPIETWPQSLQTAVSICLFSRYPILIWWGPDYIKIYNDAYRPFLGTQKHPHALGQHGQKIWGEIWHIIGPLLDRVFYQGESTWSSDEMLPMDRYGFTEETYFTFSYSPIFDETGGIGGIFTAVTETTRQILSQRRLKTLHDLGEGAAEVKTVEEACRSAASVLAHNQADVPFALLYLMDNNEQLAHLAGCSGLDTVSDLCVPVIALENEAEAVWSLSAVQTTGQVQMVNPLATHFQHTPSGIWEEAPHTALVLPIAASGLNRLSGFLVAGVSPRLALDEDYQNFFELVAGHIATAIANARAYEEERKRVEALAELDRAKTEFFSNVSHEFRTPLTLMLNPLQELLREREAFNVQQRDNLEVAHRNSVRLLKLVNTLLDFSRIQSNRIRASFQPTDLATLTADLASNFRSVVEAAGLRLVIDCPPLSEAAYIDREMWEKIVLNLLSNAFKFTFEGEVAVTLHQIDTCFEMSIRDTGIGIAEADLDHIFERFHRVRGARSRTHEGSGIGLALVAQLVAFHGGAIQVHSEVDAGTTFTVTIPTGSAHLPYDQIGAVQTLDSTGLVATAAYTDEALRWLSDADSETDVLSPFDTATILPVRTEAASTTTILIADDNRDMRDYLYRLLSQRYVVEVVSNGQEALQAIQQRQPGLVLADVMMPNLDGFAFLQRLRAEPHTRTIPVILLSARAGEESRIEGLQAGADDYLVKPFSARELLARVDAQLQLAHLRRETQATIEGIIESINDPFYVLDHNWHLIYANQRAQQMLRKSREDLLGQHIGDVFLQGVGKQAYELMKLAIEQQRATAFESFSPFLNRWVDINVYPTSKGIAIYFRDIHERKHAEEAARLTQLQLDSERQSIINIFDSIADAFVAVDYDYCFTYLNRHAADLFFRLMGKTQDYFIGRSIWEAIRGSYESPFGQLYRRLMAEGIPGQLQAFSEIFQRWFDVRVYPSRDGLSIYFADVTEQRQMQNALREAEDHLALAQEAGNVGLWDWNGLTNETYWTATMWRLYGLEPQPTMKTDDLWHAMLHPADRPRVLSRIERLLSSIETQYRDEFRILHPDGSVRWIESIARITRNEHGTPVRMSGVNLDTTGRKYTEEALREAEDRLRLMIDSAKDYAIFAVDEDGYITTWNSGAERLFGYSELEIIGEHGRILYTLEDRDERIPEHELNHATERGYAENERWQVRKDGSRFYASGMVRPMRDAAGLLKGFTKVARDTTTYLAE